MPYLNLRTDINKVSSAAFEVDADLVHYGGGLMVIKIPRHRSIYTPGKYIQARYQIWDVGEVKYHGLLVYIEATCRTSFPVVSTGWVKWEHMKEVVNV